MQRHCVALHRSMRAAPSQSHLDGYLLQDVAASVAGIHEIVAGAKEAVIESVAANVEAQMAADRKTTALKYLQGLIWTEGMLHPPAG